MRRLKKTIVLGALAFNTLFMIKNSTASDLNCIISPDCEDMGYTMTAEECQDVPSVKCQTDTTKVFCTKKTVLPILYGDGTVERKILKNKTPIGIVFNEEKKLAIALQDYNSSGSSLYSVLSMGEQLNPLEKCEENKLSECGAEGKINSYILKKFITTLSDGAISSLRNYEPEGCTQDFCKKGKWFLPSASEWLEIGKKKEDIEKLLTQLPSAKKFYCSSSYWSSTANNTIMQWAILLQTGKANALDRSAEHECSRWAVFYGTETSPLPILYGDGTVSNNILSSKTPIGIVFDSDNRLAVSLTDIKQNGSAGSEGIQWSSLSCDISSLVNCPNQSSAETCSTDSFSNTKAIYATNNGCSGITGAVNAVKAFEPVGCSKDFCRKGNWALPSVKDINKLMKADTHYALSLLENKGASPLDRQSYWTSNESSQLGALYYTFSMAVPGISSKTLKYYVRSIVKY